MPTQPETPLSETTLYILVSLMAEPRHGYAILKDVQALSENQVSLSTGTLYGALKRLLEQAWITRSDDPAAGRTARERKAYRLTDQGRRVITAEVKRLQRLLRAAQRRHSEEVA